MGKFSTAFILLGCFLLLSGGVDSNETTPDSLDIEIKENTIEDSGSLADDEAFNELDCEYRKCSDPRLEAKFLEWIQTADSQSPDE